ncbi:hypothetical protein M407DRAFT_27851 [Tulasnella calospora MUT 4182]|uniref:Uncharacterized protein n=1 Tax=Tulasnella calospora MUT 4182 TaxID=1051891 RepID=A0A0C3QD66_9AGAM|nr:hypothetical protein M407DRAFT_27851 [Tulasnella calospora MUT 4182]
MHRLERLVTRAAKSPTFASCIDRHGGPPKPAVQEYVPPKRPHNPPGWIEKFTLEGRVLLYSGAPTPNGPADWVYQFDPRSGYHLTQSGDESSNRQRDMADGHILNILMHEGLVYHTFIVYVPGIIFDVPREIVKDSNTSAVISNSFDLTSTTAATDLPPSRPGTPEFTTIVDYAAPLIHTPVAPLQLGTLADPEALRPVALDQPEDRSYAVDEAVYNNSEEHVESSEEPLYFFYGHASSSGEAESFTTSSEATSSSSCTSRTSQQIARLYPTSDSLFHEQRAAVIHELRSLLPLLEEPASQRHASRTWENAWTRVTEQVRVEETPMEEDDQEAEVHTRRKRRGGKRNTAWKNKRRQDKDDYERDPEAGPSGLP